MKTRMTGLFGIKHPIMLAGMAMISLPELVAAVSNAGGLGTFNSAASAPSEMKDIIKHIKSLTDKPFCVNVTLMVPNSRENAEVALQEKVPILNFSLGKGDWIIKEAHKYGGKVISTVATERHALRAEQDGADALVVTGYEAAAHGTEITSLVLLPLIAGKVKIPVIAAGGFCDGRGLAAALALGADGISMGTRFILTKDCEVGQSIKDTLLKASVEDTIYTDKISGMYGRYYKSEASMKMAKGKVDFIKALESGLKIKRMLNVPFLKLLRSGLKEKNFANAARQSLSIGHLKLVLDTGSLDSGSIPIGQVVGRIRDLPTCQEVIERIVHEAQATIEQSARTIA